MGRLDTHKQKELEPKRIEGTKRVLEEMGYKVDIIGSTEINFFFKGELVKFFPYSGWHTGKSIKDGRGFKKLQKQLK